MELTKKDAELIVASYSLGKLKSIKQITSGCVNYNFEIKTSKGNFMVQVFGHKYDKWKRGTVKLEFLVLNHLHEKKFPYEIPFPLKNKQGSQVLKLGEHHLWVYRKIEGDIYGKFNLNQFKQIAKAVATYHRYVQDIEYQDPSYYDFNWILAQYDRLKKIRPKDEIDQLMLDNLGFFESLLRKVMRTDFKGDMLLAHSDFNNGNVIFRAGKLVGILDFDNMQYAPAAKDIALAIKRSKYSGDQLTARKMEIFLKEYQKIRPLSAKEKKLIIPALIKDNCIVFWWHYEGMKKHTDKRYEYMNNTLKKTKQILKEF